MVKGQLVVPREERKCARCSGPFLVKPSNKEENAKRFCSRKCSYDVLIRGKFKGKNSPRWTEKITVKCGVCGKSFQDYAARKKQRRTCSRECANKSFERRITLICQHCNKDFSARAKLLGKQKYCSTRCRSLASPQQNTSIERKIEDLLKNVEGVEKQYQFDKLIVDFAIPSKRIFIECDGDYWHSRPEVITRDIVKDRLAKERGWRMLRLTETEINNDIESCKNKIFSLINCVYSSMD